MTAGRPAIRTIPGNRDNGIIYSVITASGLKVVQVPGHGVRRGLTRVMDRFGKAVVLMDHALSHRSADVRQLLGENRDRLRATVSHRVAAPGRDRDVVGDHARHLETCTS